MPELPEVETIARTLAPGDRRPHDRRDRAHLSALLRPVRRTQTARDDARAPRPRRPPARQDAPHRVRRRPDPRLPPQDDRPVPVRRRLGRARQAHAPGHPLRGRRNELRFRDVRKFGFLLCLEGDPESVCSELAGLGPEPLEMSLPEFAGVLAGRRGRIKSLLLDQTRIAGIGNIYADEMLFDARIHPETPADRSTDEAIERLYESMRKILAAAIAVERLDPPGLSRRRRQRRGASRNPTRSTTGRGSPASRAARRSA